MDGLKPFINEIYPDGDVDYSPPEWRQKIEDELLRHGVTDYDEEHEKDQKIKPNEVGIKHPETEAVVRLNDDGTIHVFASETLGIIMDPHSKSINFIGENINFFSHKTHLKTKPTGLLWNENSFNSQLYYEDQNEGKVSFVGKKQKFKNKKWAEEEIEIQPFHKRKGKNTYSPGILEMLDDLGIPTEKE